MTLSRQLGLIITLVLLLMFAGNLVISIDNSRRYLIEQLQSHAQDAATALGLSLSTHLAEGDRLAMESMVDAMFDRGYYREIRVRGPDGENLVDRVLDVEVRGVPDWFVHSLPLLTPEGSAVLQTGWKQGGTVTVRSHPGYAYRQLWNIAVQSFSWSLGTFALAVLLTTIILRYVLAPLRAVEDQALAITERDFRQLRNVPRTRELRRVVIAMNQMAGKVEQMLEEQSALAERMREEAYADPVTGAGNRRSFEQRLRHVLESTEEQAFGALLLIHVTGVAALNRDRGYAAGDEFLRGVVALLKNRFAGGNAFVARIGGSEFGVLVQRVTPDAARTLASQALRDLGALRHGEGDEVGMHIGVACFSGARPASEVMAEADMALRRAQQEGPGAWHLFEAPGGEESVTVRGAEAWRAILQNVIDSRAVVLLYQPVKAVDLQSVWHHEVLARIRGEYQELIPAGVFLPMAERLGLATALDRLIIEVLLERLRGSGEAGVAYAVNLSPSSVRDPQFAEWLSRRLDRRLAEKLFFEVSEYTAHIDLERLRELVQRIRRLGAGFGVDHFGASAPSFGYLHALQLDYMKIDGSYIAGVEVDRDNQFFVRALADIARGLDMRVIAEFVENEAQLETLRGLRVGGVQGYLAGRPQPRE